MKSIDFPSERVLEDYIFGEIIGGRECPISGHVSSLGFRQFHLGDYGIPDILKIRHQDGTIEITVLELKVETLKATHLAQLCRYVSGVESLVSRYKGRFNIKVVGELAGPLDTSSDFVFLCNHIGDHITIHDMSLTFDLGFKSTQAANTWGVIGGTAGDSKEFAREIYDTQIDIIEIDKIMEVENA